MSEIIVNIGYLLMLAAFVVRDMLRLRVLLVTAQTLLIGYALSQGAMAVAFWNALFVGINGFQVYGILKDRREVTLPESLQGVFRTSFAQLTPQEFLKIWNLGIDQEKTDDLLVAEGTVEQDLLYLVSGEVVVQRSGSTIAHLGSGYFLAEMSFLTGEETNAAVVAKGDVSLRIWSRKSLEQLRLRDSGLFIKFQNVLGADIVRKFQRTGTGHANPIMEKSWGEIQLCTSFESSGTEQERETEIWTEYSESQTH